METKLNKPLVTNRKFPPHDPTIRTNKNKSSRKKPSVAVVGDSCSLQYEGGESMSHQQVFEAGYRRILA